MGKTREEEIEEVKEVTKLLEQQLGMEIPPGACVCKLGPGHYGLTMDKDESDPKIMELVLRAAMMGHEVGTTNTEEIKEECTGIYIKKPREDEKNETE